MDLQSIILAVTETAQEAVEPLKDGGVLGTLGINWKLFIAQLINFGIVLFIFWKWVVNPLGRTLTERQEKIEKGLKYSEAMEEEKKKFDDWKQQEMKKTRSEADNIMRTASDAANKIKQETISSAQSQANQLLKQAKTNIESEKVQMLREAKEELATLVVAASEKVLKSKLDSSKDKELVADSLRNIK
ncbi:MAG: F0F1 ATP synthase subunit B [Candidatus Doudnabacteria bacterium]|nr:F0F1 ATP synthase subunit B [Candidatus Doudnabacteria bacterium]